ncbi:glycine zipper 2TM domain-containing protein [Bordetella petrii]|uniref:Glycine zipper 2TM domain-containing protein n=1 Tax=Bordetella petrii (strain ATCC BAA-461 / DSM 12804 / CCUG 43448 / CIP 107267 / Se-1111R) TaxID=340100 RepID=A9HXT1_BORPD|nr:glycine zipper 2TM domain-containing protein [Bordetella petrii]CAP40576.1 unnamed protein product [Bordetella petrii]
MIIAKRFIQVVFAGALALGAGATAQADDQARNTIIGAGLGGVAGALLSDGDPLVTLGGAAAGGVLGNIITDDDRGRHRHHWDRDRSYKRASYRDHDRHHGNKHWRKHRRH